MLITVNLNKQLTSKDAMSWQQYLVISLNCGFNESSECKFDALNHHLQIVKHGAFFGILDGLIEALELK